VDREHQEGLRTIIEAEEEVLRMILLKYLNIRKNLFKRRKRKLLAPRHINWRVAWMN
jgi:hypothetical protein